MEKISSVVLDPHVRKIFNSYEKLLNSHLRNIFNPDEKLLDPHVRKIFSCFQIFIKRIFFHGQTISTFHKMQTSKNSYQVPLCFEQDRECQHPLATILVHMRDNFEDILAQINRILVRQGYKTVKGFHYLQEDNDYGWVEKSIVLKTDLMEALPHETQFFVAKRVTADRIQKAEEEMIGVEIKGEIRRLHTKGEIELDPYIFLTLEDVENIYDSYDAIGRFSLWTEGEEEVWMEFELSTADVEPMLIWNRDDTWIYLNATGNQETREDTEMEVEISLRVS